MKIVRSGVFLFCLVLFLLHQILAKGFRLSIPFVDDYLDPFLAMPIILTLWLAERQWLFKRGNNYRLPLLHVVVATVYVSLVSEMLFPFLSPEFKADWVDVVCYAVGSVVFYFTVNRVVGAGK